MSIGNVYFCKFCMLSKKRGESNFSYLLPPPPSPPLPHPPPPPMPPPPPPTARPVASAAQCDIAVKSICTNFSILMQNNVLKAKWQSTNYNLHKDVSYVNYNNTNYSYFQYRKIEKNTMQPVFTHQELVWLQWNRKMSDRHRGSRCVKTMATFEFNLHFIKNYCKHVL